MKQDERVYAGKKQATGGKTGNKSKPEVLRAKAPGPRLNGAHCFSFEEFSVGREAKGFEHPGLHAL